MSRVGYVAAAAHIGVPVGTLRAWVSRRRVPHIRLGERHVLFDLAELDAWLAEHRVTPAPSLSAAPAALRLVGDGEG